MFQNIPQVKLGIVAVSRDCFVISLSEKRRKAIVDSYTAAGGSIYEAKTTVENENDMKKALDEVRSAGCNALVVFLGNFGPETPETMLAKYFDGPVMYVAAAEESGKDLINGRGDAYCGMLNCSYNLGLRQIPAVIPEYPVGTAEEAARMIADFVPVARAVIGLKSLKVISFRSEEHTSELQSFRSARVRRISSPAMHRFVRCSIWALKFRKIPSWIFWSPTGHTKTTNGFRMLSAIWQKNLGPPATGIRIFCRAWHSLN